MKKNFYRYIAALFILLLSLSNSETLAQAIRIMPLGNSITRGDMCTNGDIYDCDNISDANAIGYRYQLFNLLTSAGHTIDFVGSQHYGGAYMSDTDNAGFPGIRGSQLADIMETGSTTVPFGSVTAGPYLESYPADIVVLHIGTNDVLDGHYTVTDLERILDAIDSYESGSGDEVMVFLARIISRNGVPCGTDLPGVATYNAALDAMATARISGGDNLIVVDMECGAGLDYSNDLIDQVHPDQTGYDKMADTWFAAIDAYLGATPTYDLTIDTVGYGTVVPAWGVHTYDDGTDVEITATAGTGYHFGSWSGDLTGSVNPRTITMDGDRSVTANFLLNSYNLTVTTDGTPLATVSPSGTAPVYHGVLTTITVTNVPTGYEFAGWEKYSGAPAVIADPSALSTTVKLEAGAATIRATFVVSTHTLTVDTVGLGTVTRNPDQPTYNYGTIVQLNATPGTGYHFDSWSGDLTGPQNPKNITMNGDRSVTANFLLNSYNLTVTTDGTPLATVSPSGMTPVYHGVLTTITVTNVPEGYEFTGWEAYSGAPAVITDPSALSTTVKLEAGAATIRATFALTTHTLSVDTVGLGTVTIVPDQPTYDYGSSVTLTAYPGVSYHFDSWSGDLTGSVNPRTITMDGDKSITANFLLNSYDLTVETDGTPSAKVSPSGTVSVYHGALTTIEVINIPKGRVFGGWEIVSGLSVTIADPSALITTVMLEEGDALIRANFALTTHTLTVDTVGTGTVTIEPDLEFYDYESEVTLTANPGEGFHFDSWSGDLTGSENPETIIMDDDKSVTANFLLNSYNLTVNTDGTPDAEVTPSGLVPVYHGIATDISVTAIPDGYEFVNWTYTGSGVTIDNDTLEATTVTLEDGDATVQANFALKTYTLTVVTDGLPGATVSPADPAVVTHGVATDISVTFIPDGYELVNWTYTGSGVIIENDTLEATTVILEDGDAIVQANFALKTYTLTVVTDGLPGATVSPVDPAVVTHGVATDISVTFIPDGYELVNWTYTGSGVIIDNDTLEETTVTLEDGDATVQANFALKTYTLDVVTDGTAGVNLFPDSPVVVTHGVSFPVSVLSIPESYGFVNWTVAEGVALIDNDTMETTSVILEEGDATVQANFEKVIRILGVSIPNNPYKIGDLITVIISVENDLGITLNLVSGEVGGYPLINIVRLNPNTYFANIVIQEGGNSYGALDDIPVTSLVMTDGVIQSEPYELPIIQNNDPIDAKLPVINYVNGEPGTYKIGDDVTLHINADSTGYTIDPVSVVNGISLSVPVFSFTEIGDGDYQLDYTVSEGDQDVAAGELVASIILIKPSGNKNAPFTTLTGINELVIDANAPVISSLELPEGEYGVGNTLQMTIIADEEEYVAGTGTVINGVPLVSPRVEFAEVSGGVYTLTYTVDVSDNDALPGTVKAAVVLLDEAGNASEPFTEIEENTAEVYTTLPTAYLAGTPQICEDEPAVLTVFLSGRAPWSFKLTDGTDTTEFSDILEENYEFEVYPIVSTTYRVPTVSDVNGVLNSGIGSATVTILMRTDVEIINLPSGFSVEAEPYLLEASPPGGVFSGPGVISSTGYFDPQIADTVNSPHMLYYTYVNEFGCTSMDSAMVFVLGAAGDVYLPDTSLCTNQAPVTVYASNVAGVTGTFQLLDMVEEPVEGLTDMGNNSAIIDPAMLLDGTYTILYEYYDEVPLFLRQAITVATVTTPNILGITDTLLCQNDPPLVLRSNIKNVVFEGPGVLGSVADGFVFEPDSAFLGHNIITCTNFAGNGCAASTDLHLYVLQVPRLGFTMSSACISENGSQISFTNTTVNKASVESWAWNFDDIASGADNYSELVNPKHFYAEPAERSVVLTATTFDGCVATYMRDTLFIDNPVTDFSWITNCFIDSSATEFVNHTYGLSTPLESFLWTIQDQDNTVLLEEETNAADDTISYTFESLGAYTITLEARNSGGCTGTLSREIELEPTIRLASDGYLEDFNTSKGGWSIRSEDQVQSWTWNTPDFNGHNQPEGDRSWYTALPEDTPGYLEKSWMQSPCFDFSQMRRPLIKLDLMRSFVPNLDGAVLQYNDIQDEGWKTVGEGAEGIGWYNHYSIYYQPGGSSLGWGLDLFEPDQDWVSATHGLDELAGKENVKFRIAIASSSRQSIGNQGFAFDNVKIAERTKLLVLEHFTNASDPDAKAADDLVDGLEARLRRNLIDLQYHTSFPGPDPINQVNPYPASTRSGANGVYDVPFAVLDGSIDPAYRYDFTTVSEIPGSDEVDILTLEVPKFKVDLDVDWFEDRVDISATVTCAADQYEADLQLYIAILETSVTAYTGSNGDTEFRNVVLKMLPYPSGQLLKGSWYLGKSETRAQLWEYEEGFVEDVDELAVVAFVDDRSPGGKILQAAINYKDKSVGIGNSVREAEALYIYPNPAKDNFYLNLGTRSVNRGRIELLDMSGRPVISENVPAGYQIYEVDIQHLNRGIYIVHWIEYGRVKGISKLVKTE